MLGIARAFYAQTKRAARLLRVNRHGLVFLCRKHCQIPYSPTFCGGVMPACVSSSCGILARIGRHVKRQILVFLQRRARKAGFGCLSLGSPCKVNVRATPGQSHIQADIRQPLEPFCPAMCSGRSGSVAGCAAAVQEASRFDIHVQGQQYSHQPVHYRQDCHDASPTNDMPDVRRRVRKGGHQERKRKYQDTAGQR